MTIWNLGSINSDLFYAVPHLPQPGETLAATRFERGLGGKGANISVAAARGAAHIRHIGAVGADGRWAVDRLLEYGVDTRFISQAEVPTGHANIYTDQSGENLIVIYGGANQAISEHAIKAALSGSEAGDWFVCQNETNGQGDAAQLAKSLGLKVAYVAAPFEIDAVKAVLPSLDLLILNEIEAKQLSEATGLAPGAHGVANVIVTKGSKGCVWMSEDGPMAYGAIPVTAVDSTGAGDTFAGYVLACLDRGQTMPQAIRTAMMAAAIMVTRYGTADVIPDLKDIEDFVLSKG
jgi:ribokinase